MTQELAQLGRTYDELLRQLKAARLNVKSYPSPTPGIPQRYKPGSVVFSDSILVWSEPVLDDPPETGQNFFSYVSILFGLALHEGLALRVGVAYGDCIVEPDAGLYVGRPIVDAYETEQVQDWVGVACHASCFECPHSRNLCMRGAANGWQVGPLIEYDIPIKSGASMDKPIRHTTDWPFWSYPIFGGYSELKVHLASKVKLFSDTEYEARWRRALSYCEHRLSIWDRP
jgi:hypothetical protein